MDKLLTGIRCEQGVTGTNGVRNTLTCRSNGLKKEGGKERHFDFKATNN